MIWRNYIKISLRSILKHKKISAINIIGLTAGIASSLIIFAYVNNELSYDKFHKNFDSIYRITTHLKMGDNEINLAMSTPALGEQVKEEYPEISDYTRVRRIQGFTLDIDEKSFDEENLFYADSTFFNIFSYKLAVGNSKSVLNAPFSILLSKAKAKKYFGNKNPIGEKIIINKEDEYTVTGILEDISHNTQISCEFLISYNTIDAKNKLSGNTVPAGFMQFQDDYVYLLLVEQNSNIEKITTKMNALIDENVPEHFRTMYDISLMPLKDIYFSQDLSGELEPVGNMKYIKIFLIISGILILIAAINFMNLSTSRYIHRIKEVGIRKVFGANRKNLIQQFMGESMAITLIALITGILLAELLNPVLNNFVGKDINISFLTDYRMFAFLIFISLFIGLVSGSYPALFLSKFTPHDVFKSNIINNDSGLNLRRVLVILQFTIATILITFTIFIFAQLMYVKNKDLGFDKKNLVLIPVNHPEIKPHYETLKNEIMALQNVENVSCASAFPGIGFLAMQNFPLAENSKENLLVERLEVDENYLETMNIQLKAGRFYNESYTSDQNESIILNETAVKELNINDPIGKTIPIGGEDYRTIIGVIKDFHSQSLRNKIMPTVLFPTQIDTETMRSMTGSMAIKIKEENVSETLKTIEDKWNEMFPEVPLEYEFLEDAYNNQYSTDIKMSKLFLYFSGLIILISCLGIYGLASFSIEKRLKEIGIRKIMGGTLQNISILLSKQFIIWILISNIIAIPAIYYITDKWFRDFTYHIKIGWLQFALGALLIFIIAITTVLFQTIKASKTNPAEILRYE